MGKHSDATINCNTPLLSRMWCLFRKHDTSAQIHTLTEFNYNEVNENGGNTHIVSYYQHTCTCGTWQMERCHCSHALTVCRFRGDNPFYIINLVYITVTYKQQYNDGFSPLPHRLIGVFKQITQNVLSVEVGGVQIDFVTRWMFAILMKLVNVDYAINLVITGEIVQILNQDSMRCEPFHV
uniref:SWIM-type domain-containing protein n=1 Tax=Lactuca sativa TaxID=4236 RepID=A0A9R1UQU1_LACSA|nr:hypothetical protein LSAT_V11C800424150 [Lactuca sativa]